jgi:hypothetical protein
MMAVRPSGVHAGSPCSFLTKLQTGEIKTAAPTSHFSTPPTLQADLAVFFGRIIFTGKSRTARTNTNN